MDVVVMYTGGQCKKHTGGIRPCSGRSAHTLVFRATGAVTAVARLPSTPAAAAAGRGRDSGTRQQ